MAWQNLEQEIAEEFAEKCDKGWEYGSLSYRKYLEELSEQRKADREKSNVWLSKFFPLKRYISCPWGCGRRVELRQGCKAPVPCECLRLKRRAA